MNTSMRRRERALEHAYQQARNAGRRYADLNAAEAANQIRTHHPAAALARFELNYDGEGWGAQLVTVRDIAGTLLWHVDTMEEGDVGDDSQITDRLATAEVWGHDYFHRGDEPDEHGAMWERDLFELGLDEVLSRCVPAGIAAEVAAGDGGAAVATVRAGDTEVVVYWSRLRSGMLVVEIDGETSLSVQANGAPLHDPPLTHLTTSVCADRIDL